MLDAAVIVLSAMGVGLAAGLGETTRRSLEKSRTLAQLAAREAALEKQIADSAAQMRRDASLLSHQSKEIQWMRRELESRAKVTKRVYKIVTLGIKGTGKTSLTLKWANPLVDLGTIDGTKIERYLRTVSQNRVNDLTTEHIFEIGDWGGERIVEALHEIIQSEIHGLLLVVDLGHSDATAVEPERVQQQIKEFEPQVLRFFFGPTTVSSCKTAVLFINKSDLIAGTPSQIEAEAKRLYAPLIANLESFSSEVETRVVVGSASSGHGTHHLFSHFVERILPPDAYDGQLLQRLKSGGHGG